jgi:hypothetical protein
MKYLALALAIFAAQASAAQKPTTAPSTQPSGDAVAEAKAAEQRAENDCLAAVHRTPEYLSASSELRAAEMKLAVARRAGTAQDRLKASHVAVVARERVKKIENDAIASDDRVSAAREKVASAIAAKNNDPIAVAIKRHLLVVGMTIKQADEAMGQASKKVMQESATGKMIRWATFSYYRNPATGVTWSTQTGWEYAEFDDGKLIKIYHEPPPISD